MEHIDTLVAQCKSNDADAKIDAVTKLQREFEAGSELPDIDALIGVLKACLRTSNQHLTFATLSALPSFFPLAVSSSQDAPSTALDATTLRQILLAFLPPGGLIERLGDTRERAREKARESLVVLGGLAHRASAGMSQPSSKLRDAGKGQETPLMIMERFVRDNGLQSKVWRVREQAILTLVHVRRANRSFPIRPYLPLLVEALEDTDGNVRDCARQSVIELFTGPGVTDAARADLKKEMTKKNVRKAIVDSVVMKLLSGDHAGSPLTPSEGSENGDAPKKEYIPPSIALQGRRPTGGSSSAGISRTFSASTTNSLSESTSRPSSRLGTEFPPTPTEATTDVPIVYVASTKDLESEFDAMLKFFEGRETEHNWAARERSVIRVRGMIKGEVHVRYLDAFVAGLKNGVLDGTLKTLASLRTTVSAHTCSLYTDLAIHLGTMLDPFCEMLLTNLLRMAGFTKKIVATQSQGVVTTIIVHTSPQPRMFLNLLWITLQDKMVQARTFVLNHYKTFIEVHGSRSRNLIEGSGGLDLLDKGVRKGLADANVSVRETARITFWAFESVWRDRGAAIIASLDSTAKKQLEKVCPDPEEKVILLPTTTPRVKKSSVAAAIAASRAKAKIIATAPPTLRHQATATSHAVHAAASTLPTVHRPMSPSMSGRSGSGIRASPPNSRPMSPVSPPRRLSNLTPARSGPSTPLPVSHGRSRSSEVMLSTPPSPSSPSVDAANRRRSSFQTNATTSPGRPLRSAAQVPLPASPPHFKVTASPPTPQRLVLRRPAGVPSPISDNVRSSQLTTESAADDEPSLLLASAVPIPEDSDSEGEAEINLMSFSEPFEPYLAPTVHATFSGSSTGSPTLSGAQPIVEDALRARAEQAESAAERLLELVEPEDDGLISPIPPSLLRNGNGHENGASASSAPLAPLSVLNLQAAAQPPRTPVNKKSAILRQAALFKDSPAYNGTSSLLDVLQERKHVTGWWLKRMSLLDKGTPLSLTDETTKEEELMGYVTALEQGRGEIPLLKNLALFCMDNPMHDPGSPMSPSLSFPSSPSPIPARIKPLRAPDSAFWTEGRLFDRMCAALLEHLTCDKEDEVLEYGLIVVWEMLENQWPLLEGKEADIFALLLQARFCNKLNVLEATNTIRDALTARVEPVYGLTTLHGSLRGFLAESLPPAMNSDIKAASYAFGLIALGKFILRLPSEVLEEELPRLKGTLTSALNDASSLVVRESAATAIIAAQLVLRDETALFALLAGLADEKKNLLTYLFDKHGARTRNGLAGVGTGGGGAERLEREMRRLDGRTNTPPRTRLG